MKEGNWENSHKVILDAFQRKRKVAYIRENYIKIRFPKKGRMLEEKINQI